MITQLQGNVNQTFTTPLQKNQNNVIYCNTGGKATMALTAKNIPPMLANDIPEEIQIIGTDDTAYSKVKSFNPDCFKNSSCHTESPFFRFQIIYDGYDFLYYPEFKLYERPYAILESSYQTGVDTLVFAGLTTNGNDNLKNIALMQVGNTIKFMDTNDEYTITEKVAIGGQISIVLSDTLTTNHYINDVFVVTNARYEDMADSNIMTDSTNVSSFKIKFVDTANLNSKYYVLLPSSKISATSSILYNNDFTSISDLWGDDKIVSLSQNMGISASTIVLDSDFGSTSDQLSFTGPITSLLEVNSYFTLKSGSSIEILRVTDINSSNIATVQRAQLGTVAIDFSAVNTFVYFPKNLYFQMVPYNKYIDQRYVVYRNIDFVLTWV